MANFMQEMPIQQYLQNYMGMEADYANWDGTSEVVGQTPSKYYFNPNSDTVDSWASRHGGDVNALLAEARGVNSGRFGTEAEGANPQQWAPTYNRGTGNVAFQVQDPGNDGGGLVMAALMAWLGGAGAFGAAGAGASGATSLAQEASALGIGNAYGAGAATGVGAGAGYGSWDVSGLAEAASGGGFDPSSLGSWDMAGGGTLMPPPGMPPTIPGMEQVPFLSASGTPAYMYGTPEALGSSVTGLSAAASVGAPVETLPRNFTGNNPGAMPDFGNALAALRNFTSPISSLARAAGGSTFGSFADVGSGLYGLLQSERLKKQMGRYASQADPFGQYRGQYGDQLSRLTANPGSVTSLPGYQFQYDQGLQALMRQAAAGGQLGSGGMVAASQKYGQDYAQNFYSNEVNRLAQLAGAQFNPAGGAQIGAQGDIASTQLAGNAFNRIFSGLRRWL